VWLSAPANCAAAKDVQISGSIPPVGCFRWTSCDGIPTLAVKSISALI
jgi:hypothetical protein